MPRPKIHLTAEAKLEANRAKSKRHYEKSKASINAQRRKKYKKTKAIPEQLQDDSASQSRVKSHAAAPSALSVWMDHAERLKRRLDKITDGSPTSFVNDACKQYMLTLNSEPLDAYTQKLGEIQTAIGRCHNEVLQLAGVGSELERVHKVVKEVRMVIIWIDEILCTIMCSADRRSLDVFKMYLEKKFLFQEM